MAKKTPKFSSWAFKKKTAVVNSEIIEFQFVHLFSFSKHTHMLALTAKHTTSLETVCLVDIHHLK